MAKTMEKLAGLGQSFCAEVAAQLFQMKEKYCIVIEGGAILFLQQRLPGLRRDPVAILLAKMRSSSHGHGSSTGW